VLEACGREQGYLASAICLILIRLGSAPDVLLVVDALGRHHGRDFYRDVVLESLPGLVERDPAAAAPVILDVLARGWPEAREHAVALYPHARSALPVGPLLAASREPELSPEAVRALGAYSDLPEVRTRLIEALRDPNEMVAESAVDALSADDVREAIPYLEALLSSASELVRQGARAALRWFDRSDHE
jgi:HEAT repeat protein